MGSDETWANDDDGRGGSCPLALAGIVASCLLVFYGIAVVVRDVIELVPR